MSLSDYAENKVVDHLLGTATFVKPTTVYVQLHGGDPGESGTANVFGDATRKVTTWAPASAGVATALGSPVANWAPISAGGTVTHWTLWDALTGGNCLFIASFSVPRVATIGNNFSITALSAGSE